MLGRADHKRLRAAGPAAFPIQSARFTALRIRSAELAYLLLFLFVLLSLCVRSAGAVQSKSLSQEELIEILKKGGLVVYFRHAETDHAQSDLDVSDLKNCNKQRNLSDKGKQNAKEIGDAFRALDIKVDNVFTSPYCRTIDTAKLLFGTYTVADDLRAAFFANEKETQALSKYLGTLLSKKPKPGHNTVLVGHSANLRDTTKVWPKPEGVAHVFKPLGKNGFEHIGRLLPADWARFAGRP